MANRQAALPIWPPDSPVAVVAFGRQHNYHPSPVTVAGVLVRNPGHGMPLVIIHNRSPLVLQWHNLMHLFPRDRAMGRRVRAGMTGQDWEVQDPVFRQSQCAAVATEILQRPCHMVMLECADGMHRSVALALWLCRTLRLNGVRAMHFLPCLSFNWGVTLGNAFRFASSPIDDSWVQEGVAMAEANRLSDVWECAGQFGHMRTLHDQLLQP